MSDHPIAFSPDYYDMRDGEMKALDKQTTRILSYRLMGYSAKRIAEMFDLRLPDVRWLLRRHGLSG